MKAPDRPSFLQRIEERITKAAATPADERKPWTPVFPFPLEGPLMAKPQAKEAGALLLRLTRAALGITARELADFLGENVRTLQKWEQGRAAMDSAAWRLLQMAARFPEVRQALEASRADAPRG